MLLASLLLPIFALYGLSHAYIQGANEHCLNIFTTDGRRGTPEVCDKREQDLEGETPGGAIQRDEYPNLPLIDGVYCNNDGSGICKAFAGKFEFMFDSFTDKYIGPVAGSKYVDSNGYHKRLPVSYDVEGNIVYADRPINWASKFAGDNMKDQKISLMLIESFNWCRYAINNLWPYKSVIHDSKERDKYHVYFSHRQSCIRLMNKGGEIQHFNTRFLFNTSLRIDLDGDLLIFDMQDTLANETLLVKHKRQHWYEQPYYVTEETGGSGLKAFVEMSADQPPQCKIDGRKGPLLSRKAYRNVTNMCLTDYYANHRNGRNSPLLETQCGYDKTDVADLPLPLARAKGGVPYIIETTLHSLPRHPRGNEHFFDLIGLESDANWSVFARDGITFTAVTTIPRGENTVRVLLLFSKFTDNPPNKYFEFWPQPYFADYEARWDGGDQWSFPKRRQDNERKVDYLNYVDDIAYLYKCNSVLVIFGPLYSEYDANTFEPESKSILGSIFDLGMHETTNAFFNYPDTNKLYVYHRTNYMAEYTYTCGELKDPQKLVTATRTSGYVYHSGSPTLPNMPLRQSAVSMSEEQFFKDIGVYKGEIEAVPPNPADFPLGDGPAPSPLEESDTTFVWVISGIGALLILAMCLACMFTYRKRIRRAWHDQKTLRSALSSLTGGNASSAPSTRSGLVSANLQSRNTNTPTVRSSRASSGAGGSSMNGRQTARSSMSSRPGSSKRGASRHSSTATNRSGLSNNNNNRSGASSTGPRRSTSRSRSASRGSARSSSTTSKK